MGDTFWLFSCVAIEALALIVVIYLCRIAPECPDEMDETDFSWEGHAFRIVELHPDDFDRLLTKEEAARRVG